MNRCTIALRIAAAALLIVPALPAQTTTSGSSSERRYMIVNLGPLVAPVAQPYAIANMGLVAGAARTDANSSLHAALWYRGIRFDIGQPGFGGPNSAAFGLNDTGEAVGGAQTQSPDPGREDFCGFNAYGLPPSGNTCVPFVWQFGTMHQLPTLGGPNGKANMINNRGDVAGVAETSTVEPNCPVHQSKPVVWIKGQPQTLAVAAGDTDGVAAWINDKGQSVGASGTCAPFNPNSGSYLTENHALLWETRSGQAIDLGNLGGAGGVAGNHACAINNRTQVVGHSELPNNEKFHAFLWTRETRMKDLGTLGADPNSLGLGINDDGTVVGASLDASFNPRAVIWQDGAILDLNTRVAGTTDLYLLLAASLNNSGEIIGFGVNATTGELRGFLAIPSSSHNSDRGTNIQKPTLTQDAHQLLRTFLAERHHVGGLR
jgi:probable HAF family extracellular repeat protein